MPPHDDSDPRRPARFAFGFVAFTAALAPWASHPFVAAPQSVAVYASVVALASALTFVVLSGQTRRRLDIDLLGAAYLYAAFMAVLHLLTFPAAVLPGRPILGSGDSAVGWLYQAWRIGFAALLLAAALQRARGTDAPSPHERQRWIATVVLACCALAYVALSPWMPPYFSAGAGRFTSVSAVGNIIAIALAAGVVAVLWRSGLWRSDPLYRWVGVVGVCFACSLAVSALGGGRYTWGWYVERVEGAAMSMVILGQVLRDFIRVYGEGHFHRLADSTPALVWQADAKGATFINDAYLQFAGCPRQDLLGDGWTRLLHPEDAPGYLAAQRAAVAGRARFEAQVRLRRHDGEYRWMHNVATPVLGASGELEGYVGSAADVTELKRTEAALIAADQRKDQFLATLAHELRNPLAPLRSGLAVIERAPASDAAGRMVQIMNRQLTHLVRLVDDLLDVARVTTGRLSLRPETVRLAALVREVAEEFAPVFVSAQQQLVVEAEEAALETQGDAARLRQALGNLLSNAMKYSAAGATTHVRLAAQDGQALIEVRDQGMGLPAEMAEQAFESFSSLNRRMQRTQAGLGIGLSLARNLVRLHGGDIVLHSAGAGRGTTLRVLLPTSSSSLPSEAVLR
jgi:PAS domain S-box-containing protein